MQAMTPRLIGISHHNKETDLAARSSRGVGIVGGALQLAWIGLTRLNEACAICCADGASRCPSTPGNILMTARFYAALALACALFIPQPLRRGDIIIVMVGTITRTIIFIAAVGGILALCIYAAERAAMGL